MTKSLKICHLKRSGCLEAPLDECQGYYWNGHSSGIHIGDERREICVREYSRTRVSREARRGQQPPADFTARPVLTGVKNCVFLL
ncbi:MAG: hypothetical protein PUP93_02950 [Rhizonema sp. NSF051]|nr:hypothetical protein [Rhizonema sp. NSF051]